MSQQKIDEIKQELKEAAAEIDESLSPHAALFNHQAALGKLADILETKCSQPAIQQAPRITRLTVGRLFNLGHYEHVRYEIAVEVPECADPVKAMSDLCSTLESLNPKPPHDKVSIDQAKNFLKDPTAPSWIGEDEAKQDYIQKEIQNAQETISEMETWKDRRRHAMAAWAKAGGSQLFTDAKVLWDDDCDDD